MSVCDGDALLPVLHWPSIPVNAALFPADADESLAIPRGSLRLVACERAGSSSTPTTTARLSSTPSAVSRRRRALRQAARSQMSWHANGSSATDSSGDVVEIGCGPDASFCARCASSPEGTGSASTPPAPRVDDGVVTLLAERLSAAHADLPGAALVCRHTLEHIADVGAFLSAPSDVGREPPERIRSYSRSPTPGASSGRARSGTSTTSTARTSHARTFEDALGRAGSSSEADSFGVPTTSTSSPRRCGLQSRIRDSRGQPGRRSRRRLRSASTCRSGSAAHTTRSARLGRDGSRAALAGRREGPRGAHAPGRRTTRSQASSTAIRRSAGLYLPGTVALDPGPAGRARARAAARRRDERDLRRRGAALARRGGGHGGRLRRSKSLARLVGRTCLCADAAQPSSSSPASSR